MPDTSDAPPRPRYVSTRHVPPRDFQPRGYGETLRWMPALDVTLNTQTGS